MQDRGIDKATKRAGPDSSEGADEASQPKAEEHLRETGGIVLSARQIQRLVQEVGAAA